MRPATFWTVLSTLFTSSLVSASSIHRRHCHHGHHHTGNSTGINTGNSTGISTGNNTNTSTGHHLGNSTGHHTGNTTDNTGKCNFHHSKSPKCWGDHSLSTNWYDEVPNTGVTREYWLEVQNGTAAIDGVERIVLTVNGSVPGPTIIADWGDNVIVHVHNALENNGTSIVRT